MNVLTIVCIIVIAFCILVFAYIMAIKPNSGRREQMKAFEEVYIAHRGFFDKENGIPENSMTAFKRAVKNGYGMELDVQMTTDGKLVVFHDATADRMCGESGKITEMSFEETQKLNLGGTAEKIPLFSEVLKAIDGHGPLVVEIKPEGNYIETAKLTWEFLKDYKGEYVVESFHPLVGRWFKKNQPQVIRGQLSTDCMRNGSKKNIFLRFGLSNLLINFLSRPDFIAYSYKYEDQFSYRLCRKLFDVENVGWTFRDQEALDENADKFEVLVFDSFVPIGNTPHK